MELRGYWQLLRRRWLFASIPASIVLAIGLLTYSRPGPLYNAGVRFIVGQTPQPRAEISDEERLANWKTSEYVVNTLADWVRGGQFAELVSQELAKQGINVAPNSIVAGTTSDSTRSMLVLSMNYHEADTLEKMMEAGARILVEENDEGLPQLGGQPAEIVQLDQPIVNQIPPGITRQLDFPLRIFLALVAGIGIAFLVDYLDPAVRDREELETMGLIVIGEIPKK